MLWHFLMEYSWLFHAQEIRKIQPTTHNPQPGPAIQDFDHDIQITLIGPICILPCYGRSCSHGWACCHCQHECLISKAHQFPLSCTNQEQKFSSGFLLYKGNIEMKVPFILGILLPNLFARVKKWALAEQKASVPARCEVWGMVELRSYGKMS